MKQWWLAALVIFLLLDCLLCLRWLHRRREHSQDAAIQAASIRYRLDPALVKAVVWRESWFDPQARGRAGEIGLMQIRLPVAQEWANAEHWGSVPSAHFFDPVTNTLAGAWYLRKLLLRYRQADDPIPYALADYNAGRSRVQQWRKGSSGTNSQTFMQGIKFPGTRAYVQSILRRYEHYRPIFPPEGKR